MLKEQNIIMRKKFPRLEVGLGASMMKVIFFEDEKVFNNSLF